MYFENFRARFFVLSGLFILSRHNSIHLLSKKYLLLKSFNAVSWFFQLLPIKTPKIIRTNFYIFLFIIIIQYIHLYVSISTCYSLLFPCMSSFPCPFGYEKYKFLSKNQISTLDILLSFLAKKIHAYFSRGNSSQFSLEMEFIFANCIYAPFQCSTFQ